MRYSIFYFLILLLSSCSVHYINGKPYMLPDGMIKDTRQQQVPQQRQDQYEVYGGRAKQQPQYQIPKPQSLKGFGFLTPENLVLNKNSQIKNIVRRCQGNRFSTACQDRFISNKKIAIISIEKGESLRSAAQHKRVISQSYYGRNADVVLPFKTVRGRASCFILVNDIGHAIPVRNGQGINAYLFSHPNIKHQVSSNNLLSTIKRDQSHLLILKDDLQRHTRTLNNSRAYRGGTCIKPERQRIPQKPRIMSQSQALFQAEGTCYELIARRHDMRLVRNSMGAILRDDVFATHKKWQKSKKASCARSIHSQIEDAKCAVGKDNAIFINWSRSCIQDLFSNCVASAVQKCTGNVLREWENTVAQIKTEPAISLGRCQEALHVLKQNGQLIPEKERAIAQNRAQIKRQKQYIPTAPVFLDLHDARCDL